MFKAVAGALLFNFALATLANAQGPAFPDTPDDHWAVNALADLKRDGILVGYPDHLFRGNRPASRYELAVAVHAAYVHVQGVVDSLQSQLNDLGHPIDDHNSLSDVVNSIKDEVGALRAWGPDLENLKKLAGLCEKELTSLGIDVEQLKVDLSSLTKRLGVLEAHKLPVDVHGDANLLFLGGASNAHRPGITVDGRLIGVSDRISAGPTYGPVGLTESMSIYHELALRLSGNNPTGPNWHATLVEGNMLGGQTGDLTGGAAGAFPSQSSTAALAPFTVGISSFYVEDLAVELHKGEMGMPADAEFGRFGYSIDPYIFQRPAVNPYFENDRWDDGRWTMDGAMLGLPFGVTRLSFFAGKQSSATTSNGVELQPMAAGALSPRFTPGGAGGRPIGLTLNDPTFTGSVSGVPVDEELGANLKVPFANGKGSIDLAYVWLESNSGVNAKGGLPNPSGLSRVADRVQVFGGDAQWNLGAFQIAGGYSQSNVSNGDSMVIDRNNFEWHTRGSLDMGKWGVHLGYRDIEPLFGAPGDWGRIGLWWNPTDIKGPEAGVHVNLTERLKLTAAGEWYTGVGKTVQTPSGTFAGLNTDDRIDHYTAELGYKLNDALRLSVGAELVDWNLKDRGSEFGNPAFMGGRPTERWYNLGLGYNLSKYAKLSFLWQFSDYSPGSNALGMPVAGFALPTRDGKAGGNLITTQLTVKF